MTVVVFDTNIFLQGILSNRGPAYECLSYVFERKIKLGTTDAIIKEIEDVISRPKLMAKYPQLRTDFPNKIIFKNNERGLARQTAQYCV